MVFSSNVFLFLFLPVFLGLYYLSGQRYRNLLLLLASYAFYAWWRVDFLLLFAAVTLWNYVFALRIQAHAGTEAARRWVVAGVVGNLATLGYFSPEVAITMQDKPAPTQDEPTQTVRQGRHHHVVEHRAGLGPHDVVLDSDLGVRQQDDRQVGQIIGDQHIRPARQDQQRTRAVPERGQRADHLGGGIAGDQTGCHRSDTERGQGCQRHVIVDRRAPDIRTDHGR